MLESAVNSAVNHMFFSPGKVLLGQASEKLWPEYFERPKTQCKKEEVLEQMRVVRPVVETGCVITPLVF